MFGKQNNPNRSQNQAQDSTNPQNKNPDTFKTNANFFTQTDGNWKSSFYDLFFHEMENQYHVPFTSRGKARTSIVNSMFTRVRRNESLYIGDNLAYGPSVNRSGEEELPDRISNQGESSNDLNGKPDEFLNVRTNLHKIWTGGGDPYERYPTFVNYNKHRFILGPRSATIITSGKNTSDETDPSNNQTRNAQGNVDGLDKRLQPEWKDEQLKDVLLGNDENLQSPITKKRYNSYLAGSYSNRLRAFRSFQRNQGINQSQNNALQNTDTLGTDFTGTQDGTQSATNNTSRAANNNELANQAIDERNKNSQIDTDQPSNPRSVSYNDNGQIQHRWNSYGYTDAYQSRQDLDSIYDVSTRSIINHFSPDTSIEGTPLNNMMLRPSDFVYLRQLGNYSNNRLVILRRYEKPVGNDPSINPDNMPIATLIGWLDDNDKVDFSVSESWVSHNEDLFDFFVEFMGVKDSGGLVSRLGKEFSNIIGSIANSSAKTDGGAINRSFSNTLLSGLSSVVGGAANTAIKTTKLKELAEVAVLKALGFSASPSVRGNVRQNPNLVTSTMRREPGGGINGSFKFSFNTEFEFKYFSGHDPEQAMLDVIANCLTMFTSDRDSLIEPDSLDSWNKLNAILQNEQEVSTVIQELVNDLNIGEDSLKNLTEGVEGAFDSFGSFVYSSWETKLKAAIAASSGQANGVWHMTIGNPKKPVVSIGNLVLSAGNIEMDMKEMSFQDFPTRLNVSCTLNNAQPLGRQDVENALSAGFGRIYNDIGDIKDQTWNSVQSNPLQNINNADLSNKLENSAGNLLQSDAQKQSEETKERQSSNTNLGGSQNGEQ